jgi:AcrR family transcriptional regulator
MLPSPQPSRREAKKDSTRRAIVDAAVRLFAKRGFDGATVEELAAAADVGKGTIYNYFRTKEDIVVAFMLGVEQQIQREAARLARSTRPLEQVLTQFVLSHLHAKERYHGFVRVLMGQMFTGGEAFTSRIVELDAATTPPLLTLFKGLRERGLIRLDVSIPELVRAFKVLQLGVTSVWAVEGPPWKTSHELVRLQVRLFCQGLQREKRDA